MLIFVSVGLVVATALILLFNLLMGVIRGLKKTIASFIAMIIAFIVALVTTLVSCNPNSGMLASVADMLKGLIPLESFGDAIAGAGVDNLLLYYTSMFVSPLVFVVFFMISLLFFSIIAMIVVRFVAKEKDFSKIAKRLGGLGLGFVSGILASMLILMPVVGVLDLGAKVGETEVLDEELVGAELSALLDEASDDVILKAYEIYCGWIYDGLASAEFKGETASLERDMVAIVTVLGEIENISGGEEGFGIDQINSLNTVIDNIDVSPLLRDSLAGVLSDMASKWLSGETFMGMEKINGGDLVNPLIDKILGVIAESNKDNIIADMKTLTGILEIFVEHEIFENSGDYAKLLESFGSEGVITELMAISNANPRMSFLSDEITRLSVKALSSTIGIPENADERYDLLMNDIASVLNDSKDLTANEQLEAVEKGVAEALLDYGVEVEGQASVDIATYLIKDFLGSDKIVEDGVEITGEDVSEFFLIYAVAKVNPEADSGFESDFEKLSEDGSLDIDPNVDGTITVHGRTLKNYTLSNYGETAAFNMGASKVDIGNAAYLYSADTMKSSLITLDDILANVKEYRQCADPDAEAKKISDMLIFALDSFGSDSDMSSTKLLSKMGELLDRMHECELFSDQATADMVKAIFQSKNVRDEIGLSFSEINSFTDKLNSTARGENGSYSSTTQTISKTLDTVNKIKDKNTTKEERRESTEDLISNMTPDNAELLSTMTTPSMMVKYGALEEKSQAVSDSVSSLFSNMADYSKQSGHSVGSEEYAREANAVNTLLTLAMESADSPEKSLFSTEGSSGKVGTTADEYVELFVTSDVVSKTLVATVYEEGNGDNPYGIEPTAEDEELLNDALLNYYAENKGTGNDGELILKLNAIAMITNVTPPTFE